MASQDQYNDEFQDPLPETPQIVPDVAPDSDPLDFYSSTDLLVFVDHLPTQLTEDDVRPQFEAVGPVQEIAIVRDRANNSKGSARVTFHDSAHAEQAVLSYNGTYLFPGQMQPLIVKAAKDHGTAPLPEYQPERQQRGAAAGAAGPAAGAEPGQGPQPGRLAAKKERKIFVGMIPFNVQEAEVRGWFEECGQIEEIFLIRDRATGEGKGCAFVIFTTPEAARQAVETKHESIHHPGLPNPMQVSMSEKKAPPAKLFVGALPADATQEQVVQAFSKYPGLKDVHLLGADPVKNRQAAFVNFENSEGAQKAIQAMHGTRWGDKTIVVRIADSAGGKDKVRRTQGMADVSGMGPMGQQRMQHHHHHHHHLHHHHAHQHHIQHQLQVQPQQHQPHPVQNEAHMGAAEALRQASMRTLQLHEQYGTNPMAVEALSQVQKLLAQMQQSHYQRATEGPA